jgi:hypothetical protein
MVNKMVTCNNVRFAHGDVQTTCNNADRITESAKSGTEVSVARLPESYLNCTKNCDCPLHF